VLPLLLLIAVTAVWGVTFVQVKDALDLYPLFVCALILAGMLVSEPASAFRSLARRA
jgi:hypothetical protein